MISDTVKTRIHDLELYGCACDAMYGILCQSHVLAKELLDQLEKDATPVPATNSSGEGLLAKWRKFEHPIVCACADELEATLRAIRDETVEKWRKEVERQMALADQSEAAELPVIAKMLRACAGDKNYCADRLDAVLSKRIEESK